VRAQGYPCRVVAALRRGVLSEEEADRELAEVAKETTAIRDQISPSGERAREP